MDEICAVLYLVVTKVRQSGLKRLVIGSAADFSHASYFVVDLLSLKDSEDEITEAVAAFRTMYEKIRVIVVADNELSSNQILARLFDMGVYDIVTDIGGELKKCLTTGMTQADAARYRIEKPNLTATAQTKPQKEEKRRVQTPRQHTKPTPSITPCPSVPAFTPAPVKASVSAVAPPSVYTEKLTANREFKKHKQFVTVAVCASEPHMGATHHALAIAKFLSGVGYSACYLEANPRRKILYLARAYPVNANESRNLLQYEGVDMYFDFSLPDLIAQGYDFYIFDFGSFGEMEPASFLTKDISIVVGGVKAWEMPGYKPVFDGIDGCYDVNFILNFTPDADKQSIRNMMGGYRTHFSDYAPYPFASGANMGVYKEIFMDYVTVERKAVVLPEQQGKRKFFNRWG